MNTIIGLVDCNNFYASCERVFQPWLRNLPIVVLSNNDGCVIARSEEAKDLGIPMGVPLFKIKDQIKRDKIQVFSSNYPLYGDLSQRVMNILESACGDVEPYSIDEAFIKINFHGQDEKAVLDFCSELRQTIARCTGIPVGIGIATTKTLAKLANHLAKKQAGSQGVFALISEEDIAHWLPQIDVGKVWGIGHQHETQLKLHGIRTAWDLRNAPASWIKKQMTITGLRTQKELNGHPCLELDDLDADRKHLMMSRSFAKDIHQLEEIQSIMATFTARLGEKLREQELRTGMIAVFLRQNRFKNQSAENPRGSSHHVSAWQTLPVKSADTMLLTKTANQLLEQIFEPGAAYKKCGVMAYELSTADGIQTDLFNTAYEQEGKMDKLMKAMDRLNQRHGRQTVRLLKEADQWSTHQEHRSPRATTQWNEIPEIKG